jgi:hypothetical protein
MPRAERTAVDDALARIRANIAHHEELQRTYRSSSWELDREALDAANMRIGELDTAVQRVNVDARASDAERLAW